MLMNSLENGKFPLKLLQTRNCPKTKNYLIKMLNWVELLLKILIICDFLYNGIQMMRIPKNNWKIEKKRLKLKRKKNKRNWKSWKKKRRKKWKKKEEVNLSLFQPHLHITKKVMMMKRKIHPLLFWIFWISRMERMKEDLEGEGGKKMAMLKRKERFVFLQEVEVKKVQMEKHCSTPPILPPPPPPERNQKSRIWYPQTSRITPLRQRPREGEARERETGTGTG